MEFNKDTSGLCGEMAEMVSAYARKEALLFVTYLQRVRKEEHVRIQRLYKKAGGIFSWRGPSDSEIYDDFNKRLPIKSESMPGIIYTYDNGVEENNLEEYLAEKKNG